MPKANKFTEEEIGAAMKKAGMDKHKAAEILGISLKNLFETHFVYLLVVSYSHPWAWHKICKIVFLVETWTNVTYVA